MSNKRFIYDIPAELDAILTRYAHTIGTDKGMVALDSLARTAQQVLTELAITNHLFIAPLQAIHRWRCEQNTIPYITSGISAPSKAEHVLVTAISTVSMTGSYNPKLFTVRPCKRTRNYLRMPLELLQLIKSACFNTSINTFITLAVFEGLQYKLSINNQCMEENMGNQELIPADKTSREYKQLSAELRKLRSRITNLEILQHPPSSTTELITKVLLQLIADAAKSAQITNAVNQIHTAQHITKITSSEVNT